MLWLDVNRLLLYWFFLGVIIQFKYNSTHYVFDEYIKQKKAETREDTICVTCKQKKLQILSICMK